MVIWDYNTALDILTNQIFHADMALINSIVFPGNSFPMQRAGLKAVKQRGNCLVRCSSSVVEHVGQNVASKSVSAQDLVQKYIDLAEARNAALNSFISIDRECAMQQVRGEEGFFIFFI